MKFFMILRHLQVNKKKSIVEYFNKMPCSRPINIIMKYGIKWELVDSFDHLDDKLDL